MATRDGFGLTRRQLLQTAGAGAATIAFSCATVLPGKGESSVDVVVVGAGAAGSMAARELTRAGKSVVLLEANPRIGGRLKAGKIAGQVIDLGGQWVGPQQSMALKIAEEFGMTRYPTNVSGDAVAIVGGKDYRFKSGLLPIPLDAIPELLRTLKRLNAEAGEVPVRAPWEAEKAAEWDAITVDTWIRENIKHPAVAGMVHFIVEAVCSVESSQISYLHWLFYIHSGETLEALISTAGGAQQDLYVEGFHQIPVRLAGSLGERVVLDCPVRSIEQDENGVTVRADKGVWRASRVIVAVPPAMAARIDYSPELPYQRRGFAQRMPMGSVIKCFVAYERPFWRDKGLSGEAYCPESPFGLFYDTTAPGNSHGVLSGFFDGAPAQAWSDKTEAERREQVISDVAKLLGEEARRPLDYVEQNWPAERWSIGGYTSIPGPGTLTHFGAGLLQPCGRIHWSGTETAEAWSGYVDGALRSGVRAANEVLERLKSERV